jgi:hypothetical protein
MIGCFFFFGLFTPHSIFIPRLLQFKIQLNRHLCGNFQVGL